MRKLTESDAIESKIVIPHKVWNWVGPEGHDLFYGYIGYEQPDGVFFPHVPAYLLNDFNHYCVTKLQAQRAARKAGE